LWLSGDAHHPLMVEVVVFDHVSIMLGILEVIVELREPVSEAVGRKSWFLRTKVEAVGVECANQCYYRCRN
jgi:hypothetical protein